MRALIKKMKNEILLTFKIENYFIFFMVISLSIIFSGLVLLMPQKVILLISMLLIILFFLILKLEINFFLYILFCFSIYTNFQLNESTLYLHPIPKVFRSVTIPFSFIFIPIFYLKWVLNRFREHDFLKKTNNISTVPIFLFVLYVYISLMWTYNLKYGLVISFYMTMNFLWCFISIRIINDEIFIKKIFFLFSLAGFVFALIGLFSINPYDDILRNYLVIKSQYFNFNLSTTFEPRSSGLTHPNVLGLFLGLSIFITLSLYFVQKSGVIKRILFINILFMMYVEFLSRSRNGLLGLIGGGIFVFLKIQSLKKKISYIIIVGALILIILLLVSSDNLLNLGRFSRATTESTSTRITLWKTSLTLFYKNNILGIGAGSSEFIASGFPHNIYIHILLELGIIGIIIFLNFIFRFIKNLVFVLKNNFNETYRLLLLGYTAGLINISIHVLFDTTYSIAFIWSYIGLGLGLINFVLNHMQQKEFIKI